MEGAVATSRCHIRRHAAAGVMLRRGHACAIVDCDPVPHNRLTPLMHSLEPEVIQTWTSTVVIVSGHSGGRGDHVTRPHARAARETHVPRAWTPSVGDESMEGRKMKRPHADVTDCARPVEVEPIVCSSRSDGQKTYGPRRLHMIPAKISYQKNLSFLEKINATIF